MSLMNENMPSYLLLMPFCRPTDVCEKYLKVKALNFGLLSYSILMSSRDRCRVFRAGTPLHVARLRPA